MIEEEITPIHFACRSKSIETVKLLIENGADISAKLITIHHVFIQKYIRVIQLMEYITKIWKTKNCRS